MVLRRKKSKRSKAVRVNIAKSRTKPEEQALAPHSFVVYRGLVTNQLRLLMKDFRKIMEPYTASALKIRKKNCVRDFVSVAGLLHVSHLCAFTCTERSQYLKLCRLPRGPTLTFRIHSYSLSSDVLSIQRRQLVSLKQFQHAPLVVLNGLSGEGQQLKLISSMFQNLFPTINLTKVNLSTIRRCLLLNYDPETRTIDFRHYAIKVAPTGVSKGVKKLLQNKVPNLSKFNDITEFMTKSGMLSDSEAEDDPNSHVTLPQELIFRGAQAGEKSAIRLYEIGPRMTLQLMKVEEGLMDGEVLYHDIYEKTDEEKEAIRKKREKKKKLKEKRKRDQEMNKKRKVKEKEEHKVKSLEGIERKRQLMFEEQKKQQTPGYKDQEKKKMLESDVLMRKAVLESHDATQNSDDDDAEWYRKEVGEEPEKDLFDKTQRKRKTPESSERQWKKPKLDRQNHGRFKKAMPGHKKEGRGNKFDRSDGRSNKFDRSEGRSNKFDRSEGRSNKFDSRSEGRSSSFRRSDGRGNKFNSKSDGKGNKFNNKFKGKGSNHRGQQRGSSKRGRGRK